MNFRIEKNAGIPGYMQLYAQIREAVVTGVYRRGERLPSKRLLAEEVGTSVITVMHAYGILCDEGYVEPRERSGYYVIYGDDRLVSGAADRGRTRGAGFYGVTNPAGPSRRDAPASDSPLQGPGSKDASFPYGTLAKKMRRVISDYGERLLVRSPDRGEPELRDAVSAYLARSCGIFAPPERIIVGSGAEYLYSVIVALLGREPVYAVEDPSYFRIRRLYEASGVSVELLPVGQNGIESGALASSRAGVLHVTPFHSFPSGVTADATKRREYLSWAEERGGWIIEDNYDSELTVSRKPEDTLYSLSDGGRVIYLNTFSRTVAPSLRVGYMVLPERLIPVFEERLGFLSCTVPVFEQFLLAALLNDGDFERHINRVRRARRRGE